MTTAQQVLAIDHLGETDHRFELIRKALAERGGQCRMRIDIVDYEPARQQANKDLTEAPALEIDPSWSDYLPSLPESGLVLLHCSNPFSKRFFQKYCQARFVLCYSGEPEGTWYNDFGVVKDRKFHRIKRYPDFLTDLYECLQLVAEGHENPWVAFEGRTRRLALARALLPTAMLVTSARLHLADRGHAVFDADSWWNGVKDEVKQLFETDGELNSFLRKNLPGTDSNRNVTRMKVHAILEPADQPSVFWRLVRSLAGIGGEDKLAASLLGDSRALEQIEITYDQLSEVLCASEK
jgi:hypothetical protein